MAREGPVIKKGGGGNAGRAVRIKCSGAYARYSKERRMVGDGGLTGRQRPETVKLNSWPENIGLFFK